jgi:hypothetical protein
MHCAMSLYPAAKAAVELTGGNWSAAQDWSDLFERHGENVARNEGKPLERAEAVENEKQREPDRVGHLRL